MTSDKVRAQLDEVEKLIAAVPATDGVLDRVYEIMSAASAIDANRAGFALGQIFEALLPIRAKKSLGIKRDRLLKQLRELTPEESDNQP